MFFDGREYRIKEWRGERLGKAIALDTETEFIRSEAAVPQLITCQVYDGNDTIYFIGRGCIVEFISLHSHSLFVFHNAAFDLQVLQKFIGDKVYDLYDSDRVMDTSILFRLLHLAVVGHLNTRYGLDHCAKNLLGIHLPKDEAIRHTFSQWIGKPFSEISKEHIEYAAKDAVVTYKLYLRLINEVQQVDKLGTLLSHSIQAKGDWALARLRRNGIGFNLAEKDQWLAEQRRTLDNLQHKLSHWGWVRGQKGVNARFEEALRFLELDKVLPVTETGSISSKSSDLEPYRHIEFIDNYLSFKELEKATTFVRDLDVDRVHPRYNLMVNTGRTSCSSPNFQQLPRMGGIREMFVAKPGNKFIITDYSAIELATLAQVTYSLYGESVMRDKINEGADLHKYFASVLRGCSEEDVLPQWRQEAKVANFGYPGGLGTETFLTFAKGYGMSFTLAEAEAMKAAWFEAYPEMKHYMQGEKGSVYTLTGRKRAATTYCAEKNTPFQGLAADGAKLALYGLDRAGFVLVGFVHDEIICEVPSSAIEEKVQEMENIMITAMRQVVPDVKVGVESQVSDSYCK